VIVRELARDLELALEPLEADFILRDVGMQDLHRDAGLVLLVDPFVHATHAAVGDDAADLVAIAQLGAEPRVVVRRGDRYEARELQRAPVRRAEPRVIGEDAHAGRAALHVA
jgi:hypothetical protein